MGDQPQQPLYTSLAHVFQIDPDTKKSWLPVSKQAINISFYYDSNKFIYKILSVGGSKAVINSTITSGMTFTKTSQKFGQWSDAKVNTVYGLGFSSENDLNKFSEKFKEVKRNVRMGTPPATPRDPSHLQSSSNSSPSSFSGPAVNGIVTGSLKSMSSNSTGSIEDEARSPGSHRSSSSSSESQMKYENDRLKKALAQSSANAKKWEAEFQTLKNNIARLTAALQESAVNVEKWKEQLNNYKDENSRLRKQLGNSARGSTNNDSSSSMLREVEQRLHETEVRLKRKEEECNRLSQHGSGELHLLREKNAELINRIQQLEGEQKQLVDSNSSLDEKLKQLKIHEARFRQVNDVRSEVDVKLRELNVLQQKMSSLFKS